jgi:ribose/xylose/arabinose/galactoside ABC-type transport system permease subunit
MLARRGSLALLTTALGPFVALLCIIAFFAVADWASGGDTFFTLQNLRNVSKQTSVVGVAALGMTVIVISGGIDLSIGSAIALAATVLAWGIHNDAALLLTSGASFHTASVRLADAQTRAGTSQGEEQARWNAEVSRWRDVLRRIVEDKLAAVEGQHASGDGAAENSLQRRRGQADARRLREKLSQLSDASAAVKIDNQWYSGVHNHPATAPLSVLLCLATGAIAGFINGSLISMLGVVPFIVTLGTMTVFLGLGKMVPEVPIRPEISEIPPWVGRLTWPNPEPSWMLVATGVWVMLVLSALLAMMLRFTVLGRHVFAIGSNEAAAHLCGINVRRIKLIVYSLAGLFAGIAGIYNFSELSQGDPTSGIGFELRVIAAVVIGGASLSGGRGSVLGALTGAALMATITSGCTQLGLPNPIQDVIVGLIIVAAVTVDEFRQRKLRTV